MTVIKLSIAQISSLAVLQSELVEQCIYDDGVLNGPPDVIAQLASFVSQSNWQVAALPHWRSLLKAAVDNSAEAERLKYITPGHGQAMTYQQKVTEAQSFKAATDPQASDYPILSSEVGITAETLDDVADIVFAAFAQWQQIGAMIESIRLGAKRDIDAAEDEAAARAIVDAIEWPQPAL